MTKKHNERSNVPKLTHRIHEKTVKIVNETQAKTNIRQLKPVIESEKETQPDVSDDVNPVESLSLVELNAIHIGKRSRVHNEIQTQELAINIRDIGLINPITVKRSSERGIELVAGLHRLKAFELLSTESPRYQKIPALFVSESEAHKVEISENLFRNDLSILERAKNLQTYLDSDRQQDQITTTLRELSERIGKTERTLFTYRTIGSGIQFAEDILQLHSDLKNSTTQLSFLATLSKQEQKAVLDLLKQNPTQTVRQAYAIQLGKEPKEKGKPYHLLVSMTQKDQIKSLAEKHGQTQTTFTAQFMTAALDAFESGVFKLSESA